MLGAMAHADAFESFENETFAIARAHAAVGQRQFHVLKNGQIADEIEALEDEPDFAVANSCPIRKREIRHFGTFQGE